MNNQIIEYAIIRIYEAKSKELNRFNNFDTKYADDKRNRDNKLIDLPCSGYVDVDCIYSLRKSFYCCFYLLSNR